jgi:hypothetical protein
LVWSNDVDEIFVRDEHPSTTGAVHAKLVEHLFGVLVALAGALFELLPVLTDDLAARETPNWNHHV